MTITNDSLPHWDDIPGLIALGESVEGIFGNPVFRRRWPWFSHGGRFTIPLALLDHISIGALTPSEESFRDRLTAQLENPPSYGIRELRRLELEIADGATQPTLIRDRNASATLDAHRLAEVETIRVRVWFPHRSQQPWRVLADASRDPHRWWENA